MSSLPPQWSETEQGLQNRPEEPGKEDALRRAALHEDGRVLGKCQGKQKSVIPGPSRGHPGVFPDLGCIP